MFCQRLLTAGRFTDPLTRGIATASSCHGFGTAALAAGEPQAMPFAALSYGLTGIAASLWATVPAVRSMLAATAGKPAEA
jgi:putative effector of murein hydrolase